MPGTGLSFDGKQDRHRERSETIDRMQYEAGSLDRRVPPGSDPGVLAMTIPAEPRTGCGTRRDRGRRRP